ncbi:hypothetical protein AVEN_142897-1 [Araneus ventricosus]|uniref:RNA-directed DNA polymerase from mobile element jockey n=1 Tax=Araneus ventricosus TaxID=182803 RepID=A0A4Y2FNK7_ARAVE|nr:hypothetical protein AVEN_142897-1 [Araneus ventricosus]
MTIIDGRKQLWTSTLEDNTLYEMNRKLSKKFIPTPPILDTDGIKYTPLGKANAFKHSLENSFQENPEPYCNLHINEVNNSIYCYFNYLVTSSTPDRISSQKVINLIKKINPRKATGPDGVPNKAIRMLTLNAVTHLTKFFSINALSYNTSRMLGKLLMCNHVCP